MICPPQGRRLYRSRATIASRRRATAGFLYSADTLSSRAMADDIADNSWRFPRADYSYAADGALAGRGID